MKCQILGLEVLVFTTDMKSHASCNYTLWTLSSRFFLYRRHKRLESSRNLSQWNFLERRPPNSLGVLASALKRLHVVRASGDSICP